MYKLRHRRIIAFAASFTLCATPCAFAGYTINTIVTFNGTNGAHPHAGLTISGNTIYGATYQGGTANAGTVFSIPISGGSLTTLTTFNQNGAWPTGGLILSGNTLYGTTYAGGRYGDGTIFSVPATGGPATTLATFNYTNGANPVAGLVLSGDTLYGTTYSGGRGSDGYGTVFSIPVTGGALTTLLSFNNSNGAGPEAGLILSGSTLYGTTANGGAYSDGTVFSLPTTGGVPTTLATFNRTNGATPIAGLILTGSTLYGATSQGGANSIGTVFSIPVGGGSPTTLATFTLSNGSNPYGTPILSGNTFYGTTYSGGEYNGNVFSVPVSGGTPTSLAVFGSGAFPYSGLTLSGTTFYGTTSGDGTSSDGTVFSMTYNHALLSSVFPANFGNQASRMSLTASGGNYNIASSAFSATARGVLNVTGFSSSTDVETYALELTDSNPANLAADLADAAVEVNAGSYYGYSLSASVTDPIGGAFGSGYNFYVTITGNTLGAPYSYYGFDFTQLNGVGTDTLNATAAAVTGVVPEPASISLIAATPLLALGRRRR